jgi:predicted metal-binding protein
MIDRSKVEALLAHHGQADFKWIKPQDIVVSQWVRLKCMFGCAGYGRNASCPPNVPSVSDCRRFFDEYTAAVVVHFHKEVERPEDRHAWSKAVNSRLLEVERAVFLAGYPKAFLLFMDNCSLCADCASERENCKNPQAARPSPEAMAVDVFSTVRQHGYPIDVLSDYSQAMDRYAFLLIE